MHRPAYKHIDPPRAEAYTEAVMKERLTQVLACPDCTGDLTLSATERNNQEIIVGSLTCRACGKTYPIVRGIPRFVESDAYVQNFSFEWTIHRVTQLDSATGRNDSATTFDEKAGFSQEELQGKLALDVGCGTGRFMEIAASRGAEVVGIDLSFAVESAYKNLGHLSNVHIVQADIFHLPFKKPTFDIIYSIGVLHHTPNTKKAFQSLLPFLKYGGKIAIWVYDYYSHLPIIMSRYYRILTTKMPKRLLYDLCYVAVPYYYLLKIPFLRHIFRAILPTAPWPDWRWRVLDTFDWYSPQYQWWHTDHEIYTWFAEAGLKNIKVLALPVALSGEKPSQ